MPRAGYEQRVNLGARVHGPMEAALLRPLGSNTLLLIADYTAKLLNSLAEGKCYLHGANPLGQCARTARTDPTKQVC